MKSREDIAKQFKKHKATTDAGLTKQRENFRKCYAFEAGDFMDYCDYVQFKGVDGKPKRTLVQFNKVKPYINAVTGFFTQNRRRSKYEARVPNSEVAEAFGRYSTALSDYLRDNANADQCESEADRDMLVGGLGAVETALTYGEGYASRNANGEIVMGALDMMSVGYDPSACRKNLLDARWCYVEKSYDLDEATDLFDRPEEDFQDTVDVVAGDYKYSPGLGGNYDRIAYDYEDEKNKKIRVYFYHWFDYETYYRADNPIYAIEDPQAGMYAVMRMDQIAQEYNFDGRSETLDLDDKQKAAVEAEFAELAQFEPWKKKVFYSAILSGEKVFNAVKSLSQQGFPIDFKTGDRDKKNRIWTGMVNSMMEPAIYYNKALTELMFVIAANSKGGALVEQDAVEDIQEFEAKYAKTDAVVVVRKNALSEGRIQEKKKAFAPTGYEQIIGLSDESFSDVTGIDKAFLGSSENKMEPAALQRARVRQVITTLACYVDSNDLYAKEHARKMLDYMRIYAENNENSLFRMIGEDGVAEYVRLSTDILMNEYDIVISQAPQTADEKRENFQSLADMGMALVAAGDLSGKQLIALSMKYAPINQEDARKASEILNPTQSQQVDPAYVQQLEQELKAMQDMLTQAQVEEIKSRTHLNKAKVDQTMADVQKKAAETVKMLEETEQMASA